jgi:hypothetical protein
MHIAIARCTVAKSKHATNGGDASAKTPTRKVAPRKPKRKPAREEYIAYFLRVSGWDYYYGFRPSDPKSQWDQGPYSEIATLTFTGELIRPVNSKYRAATVTLSAKSGMMEERPAGTARSIGSLTANEDELSAYIFVPAERLTELTAVAQSERVRVVQVTGTKLRYRSGQIHNLSIYTSFDEEDW